MIQSCSFLCFVVALREGERERERFYDEGEARNVISTLLQHNIIHHAPHVYYAFLTASFPPHVLLSSLTSRSQFHSFAPFHYVISFLAVCPQLSHSLIHPPTALYCLAAGE